MNNSNEITVGYWSTKGLGSVIRQMVIYAEVPLKAKIYKLEANVSSGLTNYDGSSWTNINKIELKKNNSLINLPYIELQNSEEEKLVISQSNACLMYLGRKFNMFGQNQNEVSQCEQLLFETVDLRSLITAFAYSHFSNKDNEQQAAKDVFNKVFDNNNAGKMQKFEHWINQNKDNENIFLVNNNISAPDFNFFDILDFYIEFLKYYNFTNASYDNLFSEAGYPNVQKFYSKFKELPKMKKYFNSILYKLPYTNKSANFGSGINGNTWNPHTQKDTTPEEVIIK
jgi:glutathione S-transferase